MTSNNHHQYYGDTPHVSHAYHVQPRDTTGVIELGFPSYGLPPPPQEFIESANDDWRHLDSSVSDDGPSVAGTGRGRCLWLAGVTSYDFSCASYDKLRMHGFEIMFGFCRFPGCPLQNISGQVMHLVFLFLSPSLPLFLALSLSLSCSQPLSLSFSLPPSLSLPSFSLFLSLSLPSPHVVLSPSFAHSLLHYIFPGAQGKFFCQQGVCSLFVFSLFFLGIFLSKYISSHCPQLSMARLHRLFACFRLRLFTLKVLFILEAFLESLFLLGVCLHGCFGEGIKL